MNNNAIFVLFLLTANPTPNPFDADKAVVQELSNHDIMAIINHQKRILGLLTKKPKEDIKLACETVSKIKGYDIDTVKDIITGEIHQCTNNSI